MKNNKQTFRITEQTIDSPGIHEEFHDWIKNHKPFFSKYNMVKKILQIIKKEGYDFYRLELLKFRERAAIDYIRLSSSPKFPMNEIESKFYYKCSNINITFPQFEFKNYRLDFAIPKYKIAIEIDGHEWHKTKQQRERDALRDRDLMIEGWLSVRFTGSEVFNRPEKCKKELSAIIKTIRSKNGK